MYKKIILLMLSSIILSACSDGFRGYFKKSANNKLVDSKGFEGSKRKPLYNKKYIAIAKKNITEDNLDDDDAEYSYSGVIDYDEDDHDLDISTRNRLMYMKMIKADQARKDKNRKKYQDRQSSFAVDYEDYADSYPSLAEVSKKVTIDASNEQKLQIELAQIKLMLNEARKDLAHYKCPVEMSYNMDKIEAQQENQPSNDLREDAHADASEATPNLTSPMVVQDKIAPRTESYNHEDINIKEESVQPSSI